MLPEISMEFNGEHPPQTRTAMTEKELIEEFIETLNSIKYEISYTSEMYPSYIDKYIKEWEEKGETKEI